MSQTMGGVRSTRKSERAIYDTASSGAVTDRSDPPTLDGRAPERPRVGVQEALADFGVPKSKRGARLHVVLSKPSRSVDAASGLPDGDGPRYPATRHLSDRVPAAIALMGYDPDRIADSEYPWTVP